MNYPSSETCAVAACIWIWASAPCPASRPTPLAFAFDVASGDSAIAGARLEIEATAGRELELMALEVLDAPADR